MSNNLDKIGQTCPVCNKVITLFEFHDMAPYAYCSEYCAMVSKQHQQEFLAAKPGHFCIYPCANCGEPIEDEWEPGSICSSCEPKVRLKQGQELLQAACRFLVGDPFSVGLPTESEKADLLQRIQAHLKK